jgi:hypothetical protein
MEQIVSWLGTAFTWLVGDLILQLLIGGVVALVFGACFGWIGIFPIQRDPIELPKSKKNE